MPTLSLHLPAYAQDLLCLVDETGESLPVAAQGETSYTLAAPPYQLRWGHPQGTPLAEWQSPPETWEGAVRLSGHIELCHLLRLKNTEFMVCELHASLIPTETPRFPLIQDFRAGRFERDLFFTTRESAWYPCLLTLDSPWSDFIQPALANGQRVDVYASLASEKSGLQHVLGLPLVLESLTLYGGS